VRLSAIGFEGWATYEIVVETGVAHVRCGGPEYGIHLRSAPAQLTEGERSVDPRRCSRTVDSES
jgi:hypothetical protein